ncbi:hypothetical protein JCM8097_004016 [Rhodosporidiobolus ruineniae]
MAKKEENEDNICGWNACGTQFDTAEDLFNHVCSTHIGRKSAGTLSLECKWTGCHAKASKRDHLTSHCRVHIALKPHVCSICTKAFKRPQDLKKHEKIHSEDHHLTYKSHKNAVAAAAAAAASAAAPPADPYGQHAHPHAAAQPAYTVIGTDAKGQPITAPAPVAAPQLNYPFALQGLLPYAIYPGQQLGGQPAGLQDPGSQLAQLIAHQTLLNAHAAQASNPAAFANLPGLGLPGFSSSPTTTAPNGTATAAAQAGYPTFPTTISSQVAALNAQALQLFPQGAVFPFGGNTAFTFSAAAPSQAQYVQALPTAVPEQHHPQQQQQHQLRMTPPATSSPPQPASLYPQLPTSLYAATQVQPASLYPTLGAPALPLGQPQQQQQQHVYQPVKQESASAIAAGLPTDLPSPANSHSGSARSHHPSPYSSSLSPSQVPALSPPSLSTPENSFSPSPELDDRRRAAAAGVAPMYSGSTGAPQVAGKKRAFDDAATSFLGSLSKKQFQNSDEANEQLDVLSSFLYTPQMTMAALNPLVPSMPGPGSDDASSSPSGSDYGAGSVSYDREQVDEINQLLLSLGQTIDEPPAASASSTAKATPQPLDRPIAPLPSSAYCTVGAPSYPHLTAPQSTSLYPSLPASLGSSAALYGYPSLPSAPAAASTNPSDLLRLSKTPQAPTIANDYRATQYHHVARLQRAAPSPALAERDAIDHEVEMQLEAEDVDDDVKDAAAALLMGRGYSPAAVRAAASSTGKPKLPSLSTVLGDVPQLAAPTGGASRLPSIRNLLAAVDEHPQSQHRAQSEGLDSPSSPKAGSSASSFFASPPPPQASSSASTPLYPSLSSLPPTSSSRPVSAGGVERLTHRVHKLRLPSSAAHGSYSEADEHGPSVLEDEADLSATSDEESDVGEDVEARDQRKSRHKDKKSRVDSPASYHSLSAEEEDEDVKPVIKPEEADEVNDETRRQQEAAELAARRRATLAYLALYVNAKYRADLARRSVKDVRRAIKSGGAGPSGLKVEVKAEIEA